jgi:hypothetical protein
LNRRKTQGSILRREGFLRAGSYGIIRKSLAFFGEVGKDVRRSSNGMKISDISWDMVRMVSINDLNLRITTEIGVLSYDFETAEELSEALLILSLTGTKKVEFLDEARFNPARFLPCYKGERTLRATAAR